MRHRLSGSHGFLGPDRLLCRKPKSKVHLASEGRSCAAGICRLPELPVSAELLDEHGVVPELNVLEPKTCRAGQELFDNGFLLREHVGT